MLGVDKINDLTINYDMFENIKHIDELGFEYWLARELMKVLEYKEWRKFSKVIQKAEEACSGSNYSVLDHFVLKDKMANIGSNTIRKIKDYKLSRYACYLIVQNCNPRIKIIALAINSKNEKEIEIVKKSIIPSLTEIINYYEKIPLMIEIIDKVKKEIL